MRDAVLYRYRSNSNHRSEREIEIRAFHDSVCCHDLHERVSAIPGATDYWKARPALVWRKPVGLEHLSTALPNSLVVRIPLRSRGLHAAYNEVANTPALRVFVGILGSAGRDGSSVAFPDHA